MNAQHATHPLDLSICPIHLEPLRSGAVCEACDEETRDAYLEREAGACCPCGSELVDTRDPLLPGCACMSCSPWAFGWAEETEEVSP